MSEPPFVRERPPPCRLSTQSPCQIQPLRRAGNTRIPAVVSGNPDEYPGRGRDCGLRNVGIPFAQVERVGTGLRLAQALAGPGYRNPSGG